MRMLSPFSLRRNKNFLWPFAIVALLLGVVGCTKINDPTELGGDVLPAIDNIRTFQTFLETQTDNFLFNDSNKVFYSDDLALGHIDDDREFGKTHADAYFNILPLTGMFYPFYRKDSIVAIDSVILSLSYRGYYGDSTSFQTLRVYEIDQRAGFSDTSLYRYDHPNFTTVGTELGSKTYRMKQLGDSVSFIRRRDTLKLSGVIRIPINSQLGTRFANYDTTTTANGGYRSDSAFLALFRGLAIKADNNGNALTYFSPSDNKTKLIVYYRVQKNGTIDTTFTEFYHSRGGQANLVRRTPGGTQAQYLANNQTSDDKVFLQSSPGSYATIRIPGLDTLQNAVIHRAELLVTPLETQQNAYFFFPKALFLDRINARGDTARLFDFDMSPRDNFSSFSYDYARFGGLLLRDSSYKFDITRYVQRIVTNDSSNFTLRIQAPLRTYAYSSQFRRVSLLAISDQVGYGRIVIAGGNFINPAKRLRLRVVYSKL
ncbi:MAG: DUF4270 domain-containing protein [Sphingomonadales bacterium]|nr:DUF4270 domain-containing protein [Sphingomonadales bacterium]